MSLFVLDTDILTLFERGDPIVYHRVLARWPRDVAVTAITIEEQIEGWRSYLSQARTPQQIETASRLLTDVLLPSWQMFCILPFEAAAVIRYEHFRSLRLNVGRRDLQIAAIAMEAGGTVVTRNQRDFGRIPGVSTVDWSV
jgi:tRNA(fMet)-specific endonuclease VapC